MNAQRAVESRPVRTRDPDRGQKILDAAAHLIAERGYHAVSLADIGAEAGIVGSGVYRHFAGKAAILVELFERVIDGLLADQQVITESETDVATAFERLIDGQVDFVVGQRAIAQVYHHEIANLPDLDRRRLRRKQRIYVEGWVILLEEQRADLDDVSARTLVHAAIGSIQSTLFHNGGLSDARLRELLRGSARAVLESGSH